MVEQVKTWRCIGCGNFEAPQTCVGVCQDRRRGVYAFEYEKALAELEQKRRLAKALETLVRQLARTTPHKGRWEHSYLTMRDQARPILAAPATNVQRQSRTMEAHNPRLVQWLER